MINARTLGAHEARRRSTSTPRAAASRRSAPSSRRSARGKLRRRRARRLRGRAEPGRQPDPEPARTWWCSSHVAGVTGEATRQAGMQVGRARCCACSRGERPDVLVNPEVWPRLGSGVVESAHADRRSSSARDPGRHPARQAHRDHRRSRPGLRAGQPGRAARKSHAYDFLLFCQRNPRPCPLLEVTDVGSPEPVGVAPGADLRTDIPRYRIYKDGVLADEVTDATPYWRDDLVAFLLGCSFTFEWALLEAGIRLWHVEHGKNVAMWRTSIACRPGRRLPRPDGRLDAADPGRASRQGGDGQRPLPRRPRRPGARRRSRGDRHRGHRHARLGRRAAVRARRRAGVLGVRRDAAGRGARLASRRS